jgi:hypothetical protein
MPPVAREQVINGKQSVHAVAESTRSTRLVVEQLGDWARKLQLGLVSESQLSKPVNCMLERWFELLVFLSDGPVSLDKGWIERLPREFWGTRVIAPVMVSRDSLSPVELSLDASHSVRTQLPNQTAQPNGLKRNSTPIELGMDNIQHPHVGTGCFTCERGIMRQGVVSYVEKRVLRIPRL